MSQSSAIELDPGRGLGHPARSPKVIGGLTRECAALAVEPYRAFVHEVLEGLATASVTRDQMPNVVRLQAVAERVE